MSTCGVIVNCECDQCGHKQSSDKPMMMTFLNNHTNNLHPIEAVKAVFDLQQVEAVKTCTCKSDMKSVSGTFAMPAPWIVPIRLQSVAGGLVFGLNQLAMLPLTVIHNEYTYVLAGITFLKDAHFRSILAVPGGFIHYDGLQDDPPLPVSFSQAVDTIATMGGLLGFCANSRTHSLTQLLLAKRRTHAIKDFFTVIDTNYPDLPGKKTKLHMLRFHVVPFVREYKSWGKFSAQALEGSHKVKNLVDIKMPGKSPAARSKQMDYFMNRQMLLNYFTNETE